MPNLPTEGKGALGVTRLSQDDRDSTTTRLPRFAERRSETTDSPLFNLSSRETYPTAHSTTPWLSSEVSQTRRSIGIILLACAYHVVVRTTTWYVSGRLGIRPPFGAGPSYPENWDSQARRVVYEC